MPVGESRVKFDTAPGRGERFDGLPFGFVSFRQAIVDCRHLRRLLRRDEEFLRGFVVLIQAQQRLPKLQACLGIARIKLDFGVQLRKRCSPLLM